MRCVRLLGPLLAVLAAALLVAPTAAADRPFRLPTYVTDSAGALTVAQRADVEAAIEQLYNGRRVRLWVVYVEGFSGQGAASWAENTYRTSDLGDYDALLVVATVDRSYWFKVPGKVNNVSPDEVTNLRRNDIEPALSRGDGRCGRGRRERPEHGQCRDERAVARGARCPRWHRAGVGGSAAADAMAPTPSARRGIRRGPRVDLTDPKHSPRCRPTRSMIFPGRRSSTWTTRSAPAPTNWSSRWRSSAPTGPSLSRVLSIAPKPLWRKLSRPPTLDDAFPNGGSATRSADPRRGVRRTGRP